MFNFFTKLWSKSKLILPSPHYNTPDAANLEESPYQLVFICDDLMRGLPDHPLIAQYAERIYRAFSKEEYSFFISNADGLGVPLEVLGPKYKIFGDLCVFPSAFVKTLDLMYANRVQFQRKRIKVLVPGRWRLNEEAKDTRGKRLPKALLGKKGCITPEEILEYKAWMYVGIAKEWEHQIDGGYLFKQCPLKIPYSDKRSWLGDKFYKYE